MAAITIRMVEGGAFYCWRRRCRLRSGHIPERFFCTLLLSLFQIKDSDLNINLLKLITKKVVVPVECRSRKGGRQLAHGKGGRGRSSVDVSAADFGDYIIFLRYSFTFNCEVSFKIKGYNININLRKLTDNKNYFSLTGSISFCVKYSKCEQF